jgi:hypothetical protein
MVDDRVDVDDAGRRDVVATVTGEPAPVLLWMYGRAPDDVVTVSGDPAIATRLRKRLAVATQ